MKIPPFRMERWQSTYEQQVDINLSDSGVSPLSLSELFPNPSFVDELCGTPLAPCETVEVLPFTVRENHLEVAPPRSPCRRPKRRFDDLELVARVAPETRSPQLRQKVVNHRLESIVPGLTIKSVGKLDGPHRPLRIVRLVEGADAPGRTGCPGFYRGPLVQV